MCQLLYLPTQEETALGAINCPPLEYPVISGTGAFRIGRKWPVLSIWQLNNDDLLSTNDFSQQEKPSMCGHSCMASESLTAWHGYNSHYQKSFSPQPLLSSLHVFLHQLNFPFKDKQNRQQHNLSHPVQCKWAPFLSAGRDAWWRYCFLVLINQSDVTSPKKVHDVLTYNGEF